MTNWQLIDFDATKGVKKYLSAGQSDDEVLTRVECYDSSILSENRYQQNENFDRRSDFWHVASIPTSVMYEWLTKFGVNAWNPDHAAGVQRLLNSSDYRWCKVKHIVL